MSRVLRLLHIEDSRDDEDLIKLELRAAGYQVQCRRVETAAEMENALATKSWDVIISDFNLPSFDARTSLAVLKASGQDIPFILVSGCIGEDIAVSMMKAGAHDYVMKNNLSRLAPAIERELKEAKIRRKRKHAEKALHAREKLLRHIITAMGEGLLVQDDKDQLLFMNPEAERLLGWTEEELARRRIHETIHHLRPDGNPLLKEDCSIIGLLKTGGCCQSDNDVFIRKGGSPFPVHQVSSAITHDGRVDMIVTAFTDITERVQVERELNASRQQLRELSMFLQTVREEERKRIARELHDELGQSLTALKMDVDWLETRPVCQDPRIAERLIAMEYLINKTVQSMRRISEDLRPGMLDDLGLAAALEHHVERFTEKTGIHCTLDFSQEEFELGDQTATAIFRIVQESLTNVTRHSGATRIAIQMKQSDDGIHLSIQDNGCGLPDSAPRGTKKSYGILGMRERVNMLGGHFEISGNHATGTRIEVLIPNHKKETEQ